MSKAVLIVDMPKSCSECCFVCFAGGNNYCLPNDEKEISASEYDNKPDWCPLREMPEKEDFKETFGSDTDWGRGWNACIDEITGEMED